MDDIIRHADGSIDWHANGWPEPNPSYEDEDEYSVVDMPDDIFEIWESECDELDVDWM